MHEPPSAHVGVHLNVHLEHRSKAQGSHGPQYRQASYQGGSNLYPNPQKY